MEIPARINKANEHFVAIVDYGLGNLFSVRQACEKVGLRAVITSSKDEIMDSSALILTGVGAFGSAMKSLRDLGLVEVLREYALSGKLLIGICLGMQLLMTESYEFGRHVGLNIIEGKVVRLQASLYNSRILKVPHVGWNQISGSDNLNKDSRAPSGWKETLLDGVDDNTQMYFNHSYFVEPQKKDAILSVTNYGNNEFCSSIRLWNISAFQFHPECSGAGGIKIYSNIAERVLNAKRGLTQ